MPPIKAKFDGNPLEDLRGSKTQKVDEKGKCISRNNLKMISANSNKIIIMPNQDKLSSQHHMVNTFRGGA
jgi:hypothetical protein